MDRINLLNLKLFLAVLDDEENIEQKRRNIKKYLDLSADVNAQDANNNNNTPLHFAVLKDEVDIVKLLIEEYKARVDIKNHEGYTPVDLATHHVSANTEKIISVLGSPQNKCAQSAKPEDLVLQKQMPSIKSDLLQSIFKNETNSFPKEKGTSGVSGHLYESKLLCLVYLRARKANKNADQVNEEMEYFYLGTNRPQIGAFDDIYLKYRYMARDKADVIFVQAKHKLDAGKGTITRDSLHAKDGIYNLCKYFKAYIKIIHLFGKIESSDDIVFKSNLDEVNCKFIIYTVGKLDFKPGEIIPVEKTSLTYKDYSLFITGEPSNIFQLVPSDTDIETLARVPLDEDLRKLGKNLVKSILNGNVDMTLDDVIRTHHVILAERVIDVSKPIHNDCETHRTGTLREYFFSSNDEHVSTLRESMYKELVSKFNRKRSIIDKDVQDQINKMLSNPSSETISKLLGNVVAFNDAHNTLKFIENFIPEELQHLVTKLKAIRVTKGVIKDASDLIGKRKLVSKEFILPLYFGNPDIATDDVNANQKIKLLGTMFVQLLNNFKITRIIEINKSTFAKTSKKKRTTNERNIAGTVGNLLIFDKKSKLLKFNTNQKSLPKYAKMLLLYIQNNIASSVDLNSYRIRINLTNFTRATWNITDSDKIDANEFFTKLWFFAAQAQEDSVETTVKNEINKLNKVSWEAVQKKHTTLRIHFEAIYFKFHDVIQKWWMLPKSSYYVSNKTDIYEIVRECVTISPLLSILNFIYVVNIENANIRFNGDAISKFKLQTWTANTLTITSESTLLTAMKLKQNYEHQDYLFINLDYTMGIFLNNIDMVVHEVNKSEINILIIVIKNIANCSTLRELLNEYKGKIVIITNTVVAKELKQYVNSHSKQDDNIVLDDMVYETQERILAKIITFQGYHVKLQELLSDSSKHILKNEMLCKIIKVDDIAIGNSKFYLRYDSILKYPYYMRRSLQRGRRFIPVNTFKDINDDVVTIIATAGMGKSTLLSSLFNKTKTNDPSFCAIRVCLPDYSSTLSDWGSTNIDITKALTLLFKIGLETFKTKEVDNKGKNEVDFELIEDAGKIALHSFNSGTDYHLLGLQIFIDFFNKGKVTFVFDGFDEICPTYIKEVIQLLKIVNSHPTKTCIWVASRPYNDARRTLEEAFGSFYTLAPLPPEKQIIYLFEYWKVHMNAASFSRKHIASINKFMEYMTQFTKTKKDNQLPELKFRCMSLHIIYSAAVEFLAKEVENITVDIDKELLRKKWNIGKLIFARTANFIVGKKEAWALSGTPLNLYILAHYLETQIKTGDSDDTKTKWDLVMNTYALYEHFIRTKIEKICYEEKDQHTTSKPSEQIRYESEIIEFKEKHKKMALFTFFKHEVIQFLLSHKEMVETNKIIKDLKKCSEKRGFVDEVVNGIPKFVHLIFAEHFAVEHVCEKLKAVLSQNKVDTELFAVLIFVMNIFLFEGFPGLRSVFDYKLGIDNELRQLLCKDHYKAFMFYLLLEQFERLVSDEKQKDVDSPGVFHTVLSIANDERLSNIVMYLVMCAESSLDKNNMNIFIALLSNSSFINSVVSVKWYEPINIIFDSMRKVDSERFKEVLCSGYLLDTEIDESLVHSNALIISCIYSRLQEAVDSLVTQFNHRCVIEPTSDKPDVVVVTRHYSPTRGARIVGLSLLERMKKEFEK